MDILTFNECEEIFADKYTFDSVELGEQWYRVNMKGENAQGERYEFFYRPMPKGFNDKAQVALGKWTPTQSKMLAEIHDKEFLLNIIDICRAKCNPNQSPNK